MDFFQGFEDKRFVTTRVAKQRHMRCRAVPTENNTVVETTVCDATIAHHPGATLGMHAVRLVRSMVNEPSLQLGRLRRLPNPFAHMVLVRLVTALHNSGSYTTSTFVSCHHSLSRRGGRLHS